MGDFEPSELGTKAYWESHYERELQNFDEAGDVGDIWFGQQSEKRVLKYLSDIGIPPDSRILDCVDVLSTGSVTRNLFNGDEKDLFDVVIDKGTFDAISLAPPESPTATDAAANHETTVHCQRAASKGPRQLYLVHIYQLMRSSGYCVITSCNWTAEELQREFEQPLSADRSSESAGNTSPRPLFSYSHALPPLRTFTFGGKTGADTVCLVFRPAK
ncbi:unnamed protein product [Dibothriocephalus latus]|uniref:Methyltransferase domain-containing protein n=1 Tax=Dibothriocephalus latus TaxID=60516 RepID=A0A3P7M2E9_DIBLA|nr:unnamed protein product [Dibothriocephalus latus]